METSTILSQVMDVNSEFNELDALKYLLENKDSIVNRNAELLSVAIQTEQSADKIILGLCLETLDNFYASGNTELTLDLLDQSVRKACDACKLAGNRTTLAGKAQAALRNGLGGLVGTDHVNSYGEKLYSYDAKMQCATQDRGKYYVKSNSSFKAVRERYSKELRALNLINPKMYRAKSDTTIKGNMVEFEDMWQKSLRKKFNDEVVSRIEKAILDFKLEAIEAMRKAREVKASA